MEQNFHQPFFRLAPKRRIHTKTNLSENTFTDMPLRFVSEVILNPEKLKINHHTGQKFWVQGTSRLVIKNKVTRQEGGTPIRAEGPMPRTLLYFVFCVSLSWMASGVNLTHPGRGNLNWEISTFPWANVSRAVPPSSISFKKLIKPEA